MNNGYAVGDVVYRVEWRQWHDDIGVMHTLATCESFRVQRVTPSGAWIQYCGVDLWISGKSRQFTRTPQEAVESARRRSMKWQRILTGNMERVAARLDYLNDVVQVARLTGGGA